MRVKFSLISVLAMLCAAPAVFAQSTVTGTIADEDGNALVGAALLVKGTTSGTFTDAEGKYSLTIPAGKDSLVVSYVGYETQSIAIGGRALIDVSLVAASTILNEMVVTALGVTREEQSLGSAVQQVSGTEVSQAGTSNVIDGLSGKAAGLQITRSGGAAGSSTRMVLRGQTSFNGDNEALIIVDGVRFNNDENHTERSLAGVAVSNRALDLNPDDVESVTVLKGAAATALYGVEGARGVIVITTKKGGGPKGKAMSVTYNTSYTMTEANRFVSMQDKYTQGAGGNWYGPGQSDGIWWGGFASAMSWGGSIDTSYYDGDANYQWDKNGAIVGQDNPSSSGKQVQPYDNIGNFFQRGHVFTNNVAISGGMDKSYYRFSFSNTSEEGIVPLNTYNRTNIGLKYGSKFLGDRIDMNASINYVQSGGQRVQQGSNTSGLMLGLLRTPVTFDNTNGLTEPYNSSDPSAYQFADGSQRSYRAGFGYDNPYWVINNSPFVDDVDRVYGSLRLSYPIHQWLTLASTIGTDMYADNRKQEFEIGSNTVRPGQVREDNYNYAHVDAYFTASGGSDKNKDVQLTYLAGMNTWNSRWKQNYIQGDGLNFPGFRNLSNAQTISGFIDHDDQKSISLFANANISYKNMFYLTVNGRQDWLSTLIVPSKEFNASDIGFFAPSASLSFVFTDLLKMNALSFGKLRASYGQVGGGAPTSYSTSTTYLMPIHNNGTINDLDDGWTNGIGFPYQGLAGFTYNALQGSETIAPSVTTDIEFGADLRFFESRLTLDASYYTRTSDKQVIAINVPNSTGFQRKIINSGSLSTSGTEIVLGITPIRTRDLEWNLMANYSSWRTYVTSLPEGVPNQYLDGFTGTGVYNIAPGEDGTEYQFGQILGGAWQRANTDDGKAFDPSLPYNPDGPIIIDNSGSNDPSADDYNDNYGYPLADTIARVIGNPNPDFLLGITSTLRYKNMNLSFLFDIKQGGQMWNGTKGALTFFGATELTEDRDAIIWDDNQGFIHDYEGEGADHVFEGITSSDGSTNDIRVPLDENWYTGNGGGFGNVAEHFIEDASYYRLRYISFSYDLTDVINSDFFGSVVVGFTGRNLLLWTPYDGIDPESSLVGSSSNGQGLDYFGMPGVRSYAFNLSLKF